MAIDEHGNDVGGRPPIWDTPDDLQKSVDLYFETDAIVNIGIATNPETGESEAVTVLQPTMTGLAISLGVDRKTITNYANKDGFFPIIKKARSRVEEALEKHLYGKNVTGAIFNLKNNFGWVDKHEVDNKSSDGSMTPTKVERTIVDPNP